MNVGEKLEQINDRLRIIDTEMSKMTALRAKYIAEREKLLDMKYLEKANEAKDNNWNQENFPWSQTVREKLKSVFEIDEFRSQQLETINATMSKNVDVILVAPTGGGKSLCFQLPATCETGITLVVSPLVSLMEDQLYSLKKRGIPAEILSANTDTDTARRVHKLLNDPGHSSSLKLLYVTPERMAKSKRLMSSLQKSYQNKKLERIAIDEVHCCSTLGHDFRPDYKYLGTLKTLFPNTPIIGVTATATRKVLIDVQRILNIRGCLIFNSPFNRPNLFYSVLEKPSETEAVYDLLADLLKNRYAGKSGIIYTFSIKDTESLVNELLQRDCKVRSYNASLDANQRSNVYKKWMTNEIQAVIATIAFGLGIDKPDVRFVIHHTLSKSMENFYQESGRCGRDGKYAECILLYRLSDMFKLSTLTFTEQNGLRNVYSMVNYCINEKTCRRVLFSNYFTEVWPDNNNCGKMCDHCFYNVNQDRTVIPPKMDILVHYRTLLQIIYKAFTMEIKVTAFKLIDAWYHKGPAKFRPDVPPPSIDRFFGEQIVAFLILNDYLKEELHYTSFSTISYIVKGPRAPSDDGIEFQPSRIYELPPMKEMINYLEETKIENEDEVTFVKEEPSPDKSNKKTNKRKRRSSSITVSSSDDYTCYSNSDDQKPSTSLRCSDIEKLIDEKVESKIRKILRENEDNNSKSFISPEKAPESPDLVILAPKKEDVIEID